MRKFKAFERKVKKDGNENMKEIVTIARVLVINLNKIFRKHEKLGKSVTCTTLAGVDNNKVLKLLCRKKIINEAKYQYFIFCLDEAYLIVQHTWELNGSDGLLLNQLHHAAFGDTQILSVDSLYKRLKDLQPNKKIQ